MEKIKASPAHQLEYIRRRCKLCGDCYISAKRYLEVGFCKGCAELTGWYVSRDRIGKYSVNQEPREDEIEESEEEEEELDDERGD